MRHDRGTIHDVSQHSSGRLAFSVNGLYESRSLQLVDEIVLALCHHVIFMRQLSDTISFFNKAAACFGIHNSPRLELHNTGSCNVFFQLFFLLKC